MSKITITDDAGNTEEIALPADVTVTIKPPAAAPPPPPPPPPAPTIKDMVLALDQAGDIHVGGAFSVTAVFEMSDGSTKPAGYAFSGYDKSILSAPNNWTPKFDAIKAGTTTITNSNGGFAAHLPVTVLPAASSTPPPAENPPDPPKAAINVTVDGATVTVHDQTTGATDESIDFGDGTVTNDKPQ